ncbi:MAG: HipA N-terminal domain-containing protein [Parasporobacterium sp.]|nr:HipA N-terminal domain-containing protein [Parasporobacterium sp.]
MESEYRTAFVYVYDRYAGVLKETEEGYCFSYTKEYFADPDAPAVSLTLPKTQEEYRSNILFPFFDGLIPEGWMLLIVSKNWKINLQDRFGLLLAACRDCIGAVSIREEPK